MTAASVLFLLFGFVALLAAVGTVIVHSSIRAAMCLLVHIGALTGLFLLLHAQLLAALQMLVYAGAVVILFVFVIMMIGPDVPEPPVVRGMVVKTMSIAMMVVLTALLAFTLLPTQIVAPLIAECTAAQGAECFQFGGVGAFSLSLYKESFVPFELISVLLTVAIVGAIAVARGRSVEEHEAATKKRAEDAAASAKQLAREQALSAEVSAHGGH